MIIRNYNDFVNALLDSGFSMSGGNDDGVFAVFPYSWDEIPPYDTPIRWHTGNTETDSWEWWIRVLDERKDIAYSKFFFRKSGYITKEWYPYFLAVRHGTMNFEDEYYNGTVSQYAKRIYNISNSHDSLPFHMIKQLAGFGREDQAKFERALIDPQMKMYVIMCGMQQKISLMGMEYGWVSTVFCTTEKFWDDDMFAKTANISEQDAFDKITSQIIKLNPKANPKKISKIIKG